MNRRLRVWEIVEAANPGDRASRVFDTCILCLIFLNTAAVIVGTVASVQRDFGSYLYGFEVFSVVVFTLEYLARLWSCTAVERYAGTFRGRLRHALRPTSIIDLVAILPFFLPFLGVDLRFVRILLLMRMFRLAKVGRYYTSLRLIITVIQRKKEELLLTSFLMGVLLIVSASVMYYCGNAAQPEQFPDIPSTLWWSAITLTTVGYGDVFPVTVMGKVFAALIAMAGIGMFALPTGILGAGFVEAVSQRKAEPHRCPHCGEVIDH